MRTLTLALAALLALAGCQTTPEVEYVTVERLVTYECGTPPAVDPFTALDVTWQVAMLPTGASVFTLTGSGYQNLMTNLAKMLTSGQQTAAQRDFYAECIARTRAAAESANEARTAKDP